MSHSCEPPHRFKGTALPVIFCEDGVGARWMCPECARNWYSIPFATSSAVWKKATLWSRLPMYGQIEGQRNRVASDGEYLLALWFAVATLFGCAVCVVNEWWIVAIILGWAYLSMSFIGVRDWRRDRRIG